MKRIKRFLSLVVVSLLTIFTFLSYMPVKTASALTVPRVEFASPPVTEYTVGDRVNFNIYSPNYGGRVQYRVVLWNDSKKTYYDLWNASNGYPNRYYTKWQPYGNNIFTLGWIIFEPGSYRITVYAKRAGIANNKTALKGYNCDSYMESVAFYVKSKEATVDSILPLDDVTVAQGATPILPTKVKAAMSDGLIKELGVTWPSVNTSSPGIQTIQGTVEGTAKKATIRVNVTGQTAINVYSVVSVSNYLVNVTLRDAIYSTPDASKFSIRSYNSSTTIPIQSVSLSADKKTVSLNTGYMASNSWYTLTVNNSSYNFIANQGTTSGISLAAQNREVAVGGTVESVVTKYPSDVTLTFYSSNTSVATVNQTTGLITGLYPGTATITVYGSRAGYTTVSTTFTVTVGGQSGVYAYAQNMNIGVGAQQLPTITKYPSDLTLSFSSNNPGVATVNAYTGLVTGVAPGTATITITASKYGYSTVYSTFTVTVGGQSAIYAYAQNMEISVGEQQLPTITKYPSDVTLSFTSNNPSIATVNAYTGLVTGVAPGTATITITASKYGYSTAYSTFTVTVSYQGIAITASPAILTESSNNDGSLQSGTINVLLTGSTFVNWISNTNYKNYVDVSNLPLGMDYTVSYVNSNMIRVNITGNAYSHSNINDTNIRIIVSRNIINGATYNLTTGNIYLDFLDYQTPAAPTNPIVNDTNNTFGWTNVPGYNSAANYEYTVNHGASWNTCTANPQPVGDENYAAGQVGVRVKANAQSGVGAGSILWSTAAFTKSTVNDTMDPILMGVTYALNAGEPKNESFNNGVANIDANLGQKLTSMSVQVADLNLDKSDVVLYNGQNPFGVLHYDETSKLFNLVITNDYTFNTVGTVTLTASFKDTAGNDTAAAIKFNVTSPLPQQVTRASGEIGQDPGKTGGDDLVYVFEDQVLYISGPNVPFVQENNGYPPTGEHWVGVRIDKPALVTELDEFIIGGKTYQFKLNGTPYEFDYTNGFWYYFKLGETQLTKQHLVIEWGTKFVETLDIHCTATKAPEQ